ncbi:hypothetical protein ACJJTC_014155 [Scirpophaga incertulas]
MIPYSRGLILDNTNNYGIVKTETLFGFAPKSDNYVNSTFNSTEPIQWIFTRGNFGARSLPGLMMGFFSTVMASVLSLKGMFDHSHYGYQNRKDDTKTQVEIIQVPSKSEDHVYYDEHYKRGDYIPEFLRRVAYENFNPS